MKFLTQIKDKKFLIKFTTLCCTLLFIMTSCGKNAEQQPAETPNPEIAALQELVNQYAHVDIKADLSHLTDREKQLVAKLVEAGKVCDEIFWLQSSKDGISIRDSLSTLSGEKETLLSKLVHIYYGPYDKMNGYKRFIGTGADRRPECGGFYPDDMTKEEFEKHIAENPQDKAAFENWYTVIVRDENKKLKAIGYYEYYKDLEKLANLLEEAAALCDNPSLQKYLLLRAKATRSNDYFESDWAWMELKDNNIDVVIGPIESYEDGLFNYKTAFETVVMVKDVEASKELDMFKQNIGEFQKNLPWDKKYYVPAEVGGTVLQMMNVAYFGGDCNKASKTIAAALPNDPNVYEKKGGKKSMYKNMMEAKFDKILLPIAQVLIAPDMQKYISKKHMVSFVTLHEVSHNLGRGFVYKNEKVGVKSALKEKYSAIEELKADVCSIHNHKIMQNMGILNDEDMMKAMVTYVAGLFRSMRFGAEDAHGVANFVQFRYLLEKGGIIKTKEGYYTVDEKKFFNAVSSLAKETLEIQSDGDYKRATEFLNKYGTVTDDIMSEFNRVKAVPIDIDCDYIQ